MDEEKRLITDFSHSELHAIGTTDIRDTFDALGAIYRPGIVVSVCNPIEPLR